LRNAKFPLFRVGCTNTIPLQIAPFERATEFVHPTADVIELDHVRRRDLLGGLIHEYQLAA